MRALTLCAVIFLVFPVAAQSGYLPPNPITPPRVSAPAPFSQSSIAPVEPPSVAPPEVKGISPAPSAAPDATGKNTGKKASGGESAAADAKKKASSSGSVSAFSLLGLAGDNPLLGALTGSTADSGGLDSLTKLLSGDSGESSGTDSTGSLSGAGTQAIEKVIALLQREKERTGSAGSVGNAARTVTIPQRIVSGAEIARFTINGFDIPSGITTLVSSAIARDGSFLLTGDRTYSGGNRQNGNRQSGERWLGETFYLLCRKTGPSSYRLYADLTQDERNENSFLYRLARITPIEGYSVGDLIVFRSTDANLRVDLAIRVFSPSGPAKTGR